MTEMTVTMSLAERLRAFVDIVGEANALTKPEDIRPYLTENRGLYHGVSPLVLKPGSTQEVSEILKLASETATSIVPVSGRTGLVGGQVPREEGQDVLLSLERMNRIREVDPVADVIVADGGAILADVQKAAEAHDRLFPLSLALKAPAGSAAISPPTPAERPCLPMAICGSFALGSKSCCRPARSGMV
jgi:FAD/FMN-containing dehydrogenase